MGLEASKFTTWRSSYPSSFPHFATLGMALTPWGAERLAIDTATLQEFA